MSKSTIQEVLHLLGESMGSLETSAKLLHESHDRLYSILGRVVDEILHLDDNVDQKALLSEAIDAMEQAPKP